jgi:hypothetical protein
MKTVPSLAALSVSIFCPCGQVFAGQEVTVKVEPTNAAAAPFLLNDRLGHASRVPTNEVPSSLHPPASIGLGQQIPVTPKGTPQSDEVRQRILESKTGRQWLPSTPPVLMPYLANLDEYGNTTIQPGAVFDFEPVVPAQAAKYALSDVGLRYSFYQSLTMVSMTDVASGASALEYYTATFHGKWAVTEVTDPVRAGWLSTEANVQLGLSPASRTQSPQGNLGTVVNPLASVSGPNGVWMSELAWQTSLADGKVVVSPVWWTKATISMRTPTRISAMGSSSTARSATAPCCRFPTITSA